MQIDGSDEVLGREPRRHRLFPQWRPNAGYSDTYNTHTQRIKEKAINCILFDLRLSCFSLPSFMIFWAHSQQAENSRKK